MAFILFLEMGSHYIEQLGQTSYVDQAGLHLWQSLAFTFQGPGLKPVFLVHSGGFHKDIFIQLYHNLDHIHSSNILLSPQTHQSPPSRPHSLASTSRLCVCLRFVSFLSAALFLVSTVLASIEVAQSFCFCFLELPHTGLIIILTATLIGEM